MHNKAGEDKASIKSRAACTKLKMTVSQANPTSFVKTVAEGIQEREEGKPVPFMVKLPMF